METNITKETLAKAIYYETGLPITMATNIITSMFDIITDALLKESSAKIAKFGSFQVKEKKPRIDRKLNTGEEVLIEARKVIRFIPSDKLKQVVNEEKK